MQGQQPLSLEAGRNLRGAGSFEGKRSRRLLTHHRPSGRSPALEKVGYTFGAAPRWFMHQGVGLTKRIPAIRKDGYTVWGCARCFMHKGVQPAVQFIRPFSRAGDHCACAMVVG